MEVFRVQPVKLHGMSNFNFGVLGRLPEFSPQALAWFTVESFDQLA
jgi:hypothetical protein